MIPAGRMTWESCTRDGGTIHKSLQGCRFFLRRDPSFVADGRKYYERASGNQR